MIPHAFKLKLNFDNYLIKNVILILFFAILYYIINIIEVKRLHDNKMKNNTFFQWLYFSAVTQTTVGYGNNVAKLIPIKSKLLKGVNMLQLISILGLISVEI
jgi:uncharacterized membrane protein YhaH (DUF805 family)